MSLVPRRNTMKMRISLLLSVFLLLPGCMDSVNDTVNPERELFDDNTFVNEDQHIKLTWSVESVSTIRMEFVKEEGPNLDFYTMTEINYEKYKQCAEGEDESFVYFVDLSDPNSDGGELAGRRRRWNLCHSNRQYRLRRCAATRSGRPLLK